MTYLSRRGQLDKAIGALPIFFLVLFIMAVFVASTFMLEKPSEHIAAMAPTDMPILFEIISVALPDGVERMNVLEYFNWTKANSKFDGSELIVFENRIIELTPLEGCMAFVWQNMPGDPTALNGFFARNTGGITEKISSMDSHSAFMEQYTNYHEQSALSMRNMTFISNNASYNFITYKGECLYNEQ